MPKEEVYITTMGSLSLYNSDNCRDVDSGCYCAFVLPATLFGKGHKRRTPSRMYKGMDTKWYYNTLVREPIIPTLDLGVDRVNSVVHDKLLTSDSYCQLSTNYPILRWIKQYESRDKGYRNIVGFDRVTSDVAWYDKHSYQWMRDADIRINDTTWYCSGDENLNRIVCVSRTWFRGDWQGWNYLDRGSVSATVYEDCYLKRSGRDLEVWCDYSYTTYSDKLRDVIQIPEYAATLPRNSTNSKKQCVFQVEHAEVEWLPFECGNVFDQIRELQQDFYVTTSERNEVVTSALSNEVLNTNNIANIIAIKDLAVSLAHPTRGVKRLVKDLKGCGKHPKSIAGKAASGWLSYRYVYCTTMADCAEFARCLSQARPERMTYRDGMWKKDTFISCKVNFVNPEIASMRSQFDKLSAAGLAPDLYNLWDLVPYSFIVDWFTDVGDCIERMTMHQRALKYDIRYITIGAQRSSSLVCHSNVGDICIPFHHYERFVTNQLPNFVYSGSNHFASNKTIVKRIIDAISLFVS